MSAWHCGVAEVACCQVPPCAAVTASLAVASWLGMLTPSITSMRDPSQTSHINTAVLHNWTNPNTSEASDRQSNPSCFVSTVHDYIFHQACSTLKDEERWRWCRGGYPG